MAEVEKAIREAGWIVAELGRMECRKKFHYDREWNGKFCRTKEVRPIFVDGPREDFPMKIAYDAEVDALSIIFLETTVTTKHLAEGIAADYDTDGKLAGIEILDVIKRFGDKELYVRCSKVSDRRKPVSSRTITHIFSSDRPAQFPPELSGRSEFKVSRVQSNPWGGFQPRCNR